MTRSSSLASQLQKLAAQNPHRHAQVTQKTKPSILFDPKTAATYDKEDILAVAQNGLVKLETLDTRFSAFFGSLFSDAFRTLDRTLMTVDDNEPLNELIHAFLRLISPHLLLRPAIKCLEYLFRHFLVHEMNTEAVIQCCLPYHETSIFVKIISLLFGYKLNNSNHPALQRWSMLREVAQHQLPLDRASLVKHAQSNPFLLEFIHAMVSDAVQHSVVHPTLVAFYTTTLAHYLATPVKLQENVVLKNLPFILKLAKNAKNPDFQMSSYLLISLLVTKSQWNGKVLREMIRSVFHKPHDIQQALMTLSTILLHAPVPEELVYGEVVAHWVNMDGFLESLLALKGDFLHGNLLSFICHSLSALGTDPALKMVAHILAAISIPESKIETILLDLVKRSAQCDSGSVYHSCLLAVQARYSGTLDRILDLSLRTLFEDEKSRSQFLLKWSETFSGTMHAVMDNSNSTLTTALIHPSSSLRKSASVKLLDLPIHDNEQFIIDMASLRLHDDDDEVVRTVLDHEKFSRLLKNSKTLQSDCIDLIRNSKSSKILVATMKVLEPLVDRLQDPTTIRILFLDVALRTKKSSVAKLAFQSAHFSFLDSLKPGSMVECIRGLAHELNSDYSSALAFIHLLFASPSWRCRYLGGLSLLLACKLNLMKHEDQKFACVARLLKNAMDILSRIDEIADPAVEVEELCEMIPKSESSFKRSKFEAAFVRCVLEFSLAACANADSSFSWFQNRGNLWRGTQVAKTLLVMSKFPVLNDSTKFAFSERLVDHMRPSAEEFLLRCAMETTWPLNVRTHCSNLLLLEVKRNPQMDYQAFLPYMLCMLHETEPALRTCGLALIKILRERCATLKPSEDSIYGYGRIYGPKMAASLRFMTPDNQLQLIDGLLEFEVEIITSCGAILDVLSRCLTDGSNGYSHAVISSLASHIEACSGSEADDDLIYCMIRLLSTTHTIPAAKAINPLVKMMVSQYFCNDGKPEDLPIWSNDVFSHLLNSIEKAPKYEKMGRLLKPLTALLERMQSEKLIGRLSDAFTVRFSGLWRWDIVQRLPIDVQQLVFKVLCRLFAYSTISAATSCKSAIAGWKINAESLLPDFLTMLRAMAGKLPEPDQKRPRGDVNGASEDVGGKLRSLLSPSLELLLAAKCLSHTEKLVPVLFEMLACCISLPSADYIRQLLLSNLLSTIQLADGNVVAGCDFRIDLLVQIIRTSSNPQTHNHTLMLLSKIAKIAPDPVIVNVMPIFTFMGANILRQDDNYSLQIIKQTIETIIPSLISSKKETCGDELYQLLLSMKNVLMVFVNALVSIPKHRRLKMFTYILQNLGTDPFLMGMIVLILAKYETDILDPTKSNDIDGIDFCMVLANQFHPLEQLNAFENLMKWCNKLPEEVRLFEESKSSGKARGEILVEMSMIQVKSVRLVVLKFLSSAFLNPFIVSKYKHEYSLNGGEASMDAKFAELSEELLRQLHVRDEATIQSVLTTLDRMLALISTSKFIQIMLHLSNNADSRIRNKCMALFELRFNLVESDEKLSASAEFVTFLSSLVNILKNSDETGSNKIQALKTIRALIPALAAKEAEQFQAVLPVSCAFLKEADREDAKMISEVLMTLGMLADHMGPRFIAIVNDVVPTLVKMLGRCVRKQKYHSNLVLIAGLRLLSSLLENIPQFLGSHLPTMLKFLLKCDDSMKAMGADDKSVDLMDTVRGQVALKIEPRVLLAPLLALWKELESSPDDKVQIIYFRMIGQFESAMTRESIAQHFKVLFKFFLMAFDAASVQSSEPLECAVLDSFLHLVMKLNETMFKPIFLKLIDWAFVEEPSLRRQEFLFRMTDLLLSKLKTLFSPYFAYLYDHAVNVLKEASHRGCDRRWRFVLDAMEKCCRFDTDGVLDHAKLTGLMKPLVEQLSVADGEDDQARVRRCLSEFGLLCSRDDATLKRLNHDLLMATRHEHATVRLLALQILEQWYGQFGETLLNHLPETVPFLAELMEDEDDEVERQCLKTIAIIEDHLGESLQGHLK